MKKGLGATIILFSLAQTVGSLLINILDKFLELSLLKVTLPLSFIISTSIFISFGFHLNKKYKGKVTYWKFILVGLFISILSFAFVMITSILMDPSPLSTENMIGLIFFTIMLFVECLVVGLFHKLLKLRKPSNDNDSLDSDIVNE